MDGNTVCMIYKYRLHDLFSRGIPLFFPLPHTHKHTTPFHVLEMAVCVCVWQETSEKHTHTQAHIYYDRWKENFRWGEVQKEVPRPPPPNIKIWVMGGGERYVRKDLYRYERNFDDVWLNYVCLCVCLFLKTGRLWFKILMYICQIYAYVFRKIVYKILGNLLD